MSTEDDDYRSSDDEDYVPEGAAVDDDVDEPSGDECDEVNYSIADEYLAYSFRLTRFLIENVPLVKAILVFE